jgi:hypothetical protein
MPGPLSNARDELAGKVVELPNTNRALQAENAERRRAEKLLRESERRFRPLIERSSECGHHVRPARDDPLC